MDVCWARMNKLSNSEPSSRNESGSLGPEGRTIGVRVLISTILGTSMAFIDGTVVNVALPALQTSFQASASDVQ